MTNANPENDRNGRCSIQFGTRLVALYGDCTLLWRLCKMEEERTKKMRRATPPTICFRSLTTDRHARTSSRAKRLRAFLMVCRWKHVAAGRECQQCCREKGLVEHYGTPQSAKERGLRRRGVATHPHSSLGSSSTRTRCPLFLHQAMASLEDGDPSPVSIQTAHSQVQPAVSHVSEDRVDDNDDAWSEEEADEEGPKRKRARPLSALSCCSLRVFLFSVLPAPSVCSAFRMGM